ncbi:XRN 5'-3' exonuclease N-terminus [Novymonas esmeraldas]|uniref:XRN 5'-3' exonuclease N-terminus n=1 Tax=Novymonas esmeraldas TaxID=1808958 RepID=A0AAW0FC63_9TRYP
MGVKGLWSYVEHHHIQYAYPNKNARADCYGVNPRHLLIDMNAVLHVAYDASAPTTAATLRAVAAKVDELLSKVRPHDTLTLVYDGVAPLAKLKTQKERRHSLSVHPPRPATSAVGGGSSRRVSHGAVSVSPWYTCDPVRGEVPLHREEITCGAEFVLACEEYVTAHLQRQRAQHSWSTLSVCGCREPGEGEVKIASLVRWLWARTAADGTYSPDDAVTLVGNDSDLALVAMVSVAYSYFTLIDPFDLSLTSLRELMDHWSQAVPNPPLPAALLPSYRIDFVFLMLLSGDDYYDGIRGDSVALWRRYRHLRANEGFFRRALVSGPHLGLDLELLRAVLARTGSMTAQLARVPRNKRKTTKALLRGGGGGGGGSAKDGTELLKAALWGLRSYVCGRCPDFGFLAQQEGPPSVGSLRAAVQARGLERRLACDAAGMTEHIFTPLEQCLAVLGIRGRFSVALNNAIRAATPDDGHTLTTSTSISLVTETVKSIMAAVDTARLTEAERLLSRVQPVETGNAVSGVGEDGGAEDVWAFMRLAAVPPRTATAATTADPPSSRVSESASDAEDAVEDGEAHGADARAE